MSVAATHIHRLVAAAAGPPGRAVHMRSSRAAPAIFRALSSNASTNNPPSSPRPSPAPWILDERTLLSQLSPRKRIICLCPVPFGRGKVRVPWSGGGPSHYPEDETIIDLDFQSHADTMRDATRTQPPMVAKYRYGEKYSIGVAVSDPYLKYAQPVHLGGDGNGNADIKRQFSAEIVPTLQCDVHNLGSSPIFHTNLPYFRNDFLQRIGHLDVGAIVLAMPMKPTENPSCPTPTKVQLEQERKLDRVGKCLLGVLQNYVTVEDCEDEDSMHVDGNDSASEADEGSETAAAKRRPKPLGPLDIQGRIDHRLSIADVLAKTDGNCRHGSWDQISKSLQQIQHIDMMGRVPNKGGRSYSLGNREYGSHNVFQSVPPEIHAAVALNAMMEKYTSGFHNIRL